MLNCQRIIRYTKPKVILNILYNLCLRSHFIRKRYQKYSITKWKNRHLKLNTIVVIGDSHVNFFSGHENISFQLLMYGGGSINSCCDINSKFSTLHLGPCLAYSLNKFNTSVKGREKVEYLLKNNFIRKADTVIFVLGEIDIRVHLLKQVKRQNATLEKSINEILDNYFQLLLSIKNLYQLNLYCWGAISTQKDSTPQNPEFPSYGSEADRNKATLLFNELLEKKCCTEEIGFISISSQLIDENYLTNSYYISSDGCHLSQKAWEQIAKNKFHAAGLL